MTVESVAFITDDFSPNINPPLPGGCAYYRCFLPMQTLGVETRLGRPAWTGMDGFGVMESRTRAQFGFDVVYIKLLMSRQIPYQIAAAQKLGQKIVVDIDDFYDDLPESNLAFKATDPTLSKHVNRDHYRRVIEAADRVTVATQFLYDYYSQIHPDVRLVRNGILPNEFTPRKVLNRKPVVGWVGGIPWRGGDLETLRGWLPEFLDKHDLMFHHSGHAEKVPGQDNVPAFADVVGIDKSRVTTSPLKLINEYPSLFSFDIGLIPLNDIPFNHAKSFLKGIEYSAANIPFIAQGLPEYQLLHGMGTGRVAFSDADWAHHATQLLDYGTRKRDARINRENVLRDHTIMCRENDWQSALLEWD